MTIATDYTTEEVTRSGCEFPPEWQLLTDSRTGRKLMQLTTAPHPSEAVYFESQAFTADERFVVFRSWRTGASELFRLCIADGSITQITGNAGDTGASVCMHPAGRHLWWIGHDAVWRADVETLEIEQVYANKGRFGGRLLPFPVCFSGDASRISLVTHGGEGEGASLILLDVHTGTARQVLRWPVRFSHPLICPSDPDLITFVPDGAACWNMDLPRSQRVRTWLADARTGEASPFITPHLYRTVTHESWSPDGKRMFFFDKNWRVWTPASICSVDREGGDWRVHYTTYEHHLGHGVCSPDGRHFLADCQKKGESPLILIDLADGSSQILCWPDASDEGGHPTSSHVHASWSPSGKRIVYTSDVSGVPQVYMVTLD